MIWGKTQMSFMNLPARWGAGAVFLAIVAISFGSSFANDPTNGTRHPVSIVEADVYVQQFKTTMRLKCFADDLELLQGVQPDEEGLYNSDELIEATEDHGKFLAERIQLIDASGQVMKPKITGIVHMEIPEKGIRSGELMGYSLGYQIEFSCEKAPEFLTIQQNMIGEGYLLPSELKVLLRQAGSDTPYLQMIKPQIPETFRFDWSKPVLAEDASEEDWQAWFDKQREETLGITSYSSVYSFIYIERFEVRHEILIPLASLATMIDFARADPYYLEIPEQDLAAEQMRKFFSVGNDVTIDGIPVQPVFDRVDFYGLDLRDFAMQSERSRMSMANGRVGLILAYPCKSPPKEVTVSWDLFNDAIKTVDSVIFVGNKVEKTQFSSFIDSNTWRWTADGSIPELPALTEIAADDMPKKPAPQVPLGSAAILVMGFVILVLRRPGNFAARSSILAALMIASWIAWPFMRYSLPIKTAYASVEATTADSVFERLHQNMFRAFDYYSESDVYDALARSVDGPLLRDLYLKIQDSLRVREQGGAVSRIDEVQLETGNMLESQTGAEIPAFDYRCKWNLVGSIEHWGHIHQRINQYDAQFHVELRDGSWKITSMQTLDEPKPGQVKTSLRKF